MPPNTATAEENADHGSDFTSRHLERAAADLKIRLVFSRQGKPRGPGKIERYLDTINQMCLPALPGYAPGRAGQARLSLAELDAATGRFIIAAITIARTARPAIHPRPAGTRPGSCHTCPARWSNWTCCCSPPPSPARFTRTGSGSRDCATSTRSWPATSASRSLSATTHATWPRSGSSSRAPNLCRAISPDHAGDTITLKDIQAARIARRRSVRGQLNERAAAVAEFLPARAPRPKPSATAPDPPRPRLRTYLEDTK